MSLAGSTYNITVDLSPIVTLVTITAVLYIAYRFCRAVKGDAPSCCPHEVAPETEEEEEEECDCCEKCDCECHDDEDGEGGGETGDPSPQPA